MYGKSFSNDDEVNINHLRYSLNCQRRMKIEALSPCKNVLKEHINRANNQTYIWRNCLQQFSAIENPEEHGWCLIDGKLDILWMTCNPAPEEDIELIPCDCRRCGGSCICAENVHVHKPYSKDFVYLYANQLKIPKAKKWSMLGFISEISQSLIKAEKASSAPGSAGRPPKRSMICEEEATPKRSRVPKVALPHIDSRFDQYAHWPEHKEKKNMCRHCKKGYRRERPCLYIIASPDYADRNKKVFQWAKSQKSLVFQDHRKKTAKQKREEEELCAMKAITKSLGGDNECEKKSSVQDPCKAFGAYMTQALSDMNQMDHIIAMKNIQGAIFQVQMQNFQQQQNMGNPYQQKPGGSNQYHQLTPVQGNFNFSDIINS
eukprot:gene1008-329_t